MTPAELFRKLSSLGLDNGQIAGVLEIMDADAETRKEKGRQRWRKWKEGAGANVSKRLPTTANVSSQLARGEDSSSKEDITNKEDRKKDTAPAALSDLEAFKAELPELEGDRLIAVLKHRKAKRAQISGHSAKLFRADATNCGMSVIEAADTSISRNWITVKPEYFSGRHSTAPPRAGSPPKGRDFNDILDELQGKPRHDAQTGPTVDASVNRTDFGGSTNLVQLHALSARS